MTVSGLVAVCRYGVDIDVEYPRSNRDPSHASLLTHLADGGCKHLFAFVDMATRLHPPTEFRMMNQQEPAAALVEHKRAGGNVSWVEVIGRERLRAAADEFEEGINILRLLSRGVVGFEKRAQVVDAVDGLMIDLARRGIFRVQTNSMMAISAPSPRRGPSLVIRV